MLRSRCIVIPMVLYLPVVLFFVLVPVLNEAVELPRSIFLIIFTIIFLLLNPKILYGRNKLFYLPLLMPVTYLVSAFANQQNIFEALFGGYKRNFGILTFMAVGIIYLAAIHLNLSNGIKLYKLTLLPLAVLSVIYALMQITKNDFLRWGEADRVVLTIGNSNYAASYLAILLPTALYGFMYTKRQSIRIFNVLLFLALVYSGLKTQSFQFNVVAVIAIATFLIITFYHVLVRINLAIRIICTLGFITTLIYIVTKYYAVINEFTNSSDRFSQQQAGIRIFKDNFLFGVGVDNLYKFMPFYMSAEDVRREGGDIVPDKTHNVFIDHFANGGIFVGISYTISIFIIFYFLYKSAKISQKINIDLALPGSIFVGYVGQLFINTDSILNMIVPYISMGIISQFYSSLANGEKTQITTKNKFLGIRILSLVLILLVVPLSTRIVSMDIEIRNILNSKYTNGDKVIEILNRWPYPKSTELVMVKYVQDLNNCPFVDRVASRLLELDSRSNQAFFVKGICADAYGDQISALNYIKKATDLHPVNIRYLNARYQLEKSLGYESAAFNTKDVIDSIINNSRP